MTNEELILMKLENIESQIEPVLRFTNSVKELKDDLVPLQMAAFQALSNELQEIEAGFQLEDFLELLKQALRSTGDLISALKTLSNMIVEMIIENNIVLMIITFDF